MTSTKHLRKYTGYHHLLQNGPGVSKTNQTNKIDTGEA